MDALEDRVAHGARLLDLVHPDWAKTVAVDELDMSMQSTDICGLIDGAVKIVGFDIVSIIERIEIGVMPTMDEEFDQLDDAWRREISARR